MLWVYTNRDIFPSKNNVTVHFLQSDLLFLLLIRQDRDQLRKMSF